MKQNDLSQAYFSHLQEVEQNLHLEEKIQEYLLLHQTEESKEFLNKKEEMKQEIKQEIRQEMRQEIRQIVREYLRTEPLNIQLKF